MAIRYKDLLDLLMQRADRLALVDAATGRVDAVELEFYMFNALLSIVETVDLNDYTIRSSRIVTTTAGVDSYTVPDDFGRLITPRVRNRRGIFLNDTANDYDLEYVDPNVFIRQEIVPQRRPDRFTVMGRSLLLGPVPDANGANNYRIHGVYIKHVERPDLEEVVPLPYPSVLIDEAIFILASDIGKVSDAIVARRNAALAKLSGAPRGNADRIARNPVQG
jgi:hypothetical protein